MREHFKTVLLAGLILSSLYLTYMLWFGSPYLEEGVLPRYEFAYFSPPPSAEMLIMPESIVLEQGQDGEKQINLYCRDEAEHAGIWEHAHDLLKQRLPGSIAERPDLEELDALLEDASFKLLFRFKPPLPKSFLWEDAGFPDELHAVTLFFVNEHSYALLHGREKELYSWMDWSGEELKALIPQKYSKKDNLAAKLPSHFILASSHADDGAAEISLIKPHLEPDNGETAPAENDNENENDSENEKDNVENSAHTLDHNISTVKDDEKETLPGDTPEPGDELETRENNEAVEGEAAESEEFEGEEVELPQAPEDNGENEHSLPEQLEQQERWDITVRNQIFVPVKKSAAELSLAREDLPKKELVSAFFLDPAMARRIEERDGAIYYTDGKRGLRLYAGGAVEYNAPGVEVFTNRLSYSAALLDAAANQSFYGGWPSAAFLYRREQTAGSYRFFWRNYVDGLPLIAEESSCEMVVNDKGMPYYRRGFYVITEKSDAALPYHHYKEVLFEALELHRDELSLREVTLLSLEQVYRVVPSGTGATAVPAWSVHFAETGRFFLHWQTLELI